jgi:hypothetical protein
VKARSGGGEGKQLVCCTLEEARESKAQEGSRASAVRRANIAIWFDGADRKGGEGSNWGEGKGAGRRGRCVSANSPAENGTGHCQKNKGRKTCERRLKSNV